jgi:hypothetical protein
LCLSVSKHAANKELEAQGQFLNLSRSALTSGAVSFHYGELRLEEGSFQNQAKQSSKKIHTEGFFSDAGEKAGDLWEMAEFV